MGRNMELFDTSNFHKDHPLYSTTSHRVPGENEKRDGFGGSHRVRGTETEDVFPRCCLASSKIAKEGQRRGKHYVKKTSSSSKFLTNPEQ